MAQIVDVPARHGSAGRPAVHRRPFGLLKELERPGDVFRDIGPNWYASVMGTGIVAIAGADLPFRVPGMRTFATAVWALSAAALAGTIALAARTGADAFRWATVPLYLLLLAAWLIVAARTARGTATGQLLQPMPAPAQPADSERPPVSPPEAA
jgi:tellurite resistance protein TehA-like permease